MTGQYLLKPPSITPSRSRSSTTPMNMTVSPRNKSDSFPYVGGSVSSDRPAEGRAPRYTSIRYTRTAVSWNMAARSVSEYPVDMRLKALYITWYE